MTCYFCDRTTEKYKNFYIHFEVKKICGQCHSIHKLLRGQSVPIILFGKRRINGFTASRFDRF